jgi:hypothetical protein
MANQTYQAFEPAIWTPKLLWYFEMALQAKKVATDYSADAQGSVVNVPILTDGFTPAAIVTTTGAVTPTALADTKTSITLNKWYADAFHLTNYQARRILPSYNLADSYIKTMGYNLAKYVDADILLKASSGTFSCGNSVTTIPSTTLEEALRIAASQNMPFDECRWVLTPKAYWKQLAGVAKYYDASIYGRATIPDGFVDRLYGIPVLVSNNTKALLAGTGRWNYLLHPSSIGYAIASNGVELHELPAEALRKSYAGEVQWGSACLRAGRIIKIIEKT